MGRGRALTFVVFAVAAVGAIAAYAILNFEQRPGFNELPDGWFERPGRDPAGWTLPGMLVVRVETKGAANLEVIPEDRTDLAASLITGPGGAPHSLTPAPGNLLLINSEAKARCPATPRPDAPTLVLRLPRSARIETKGAVAASVGQTDRLQIVSRGCATWRLAGARQLSAAIAKGGSLNGGRFEDVRLNLRGPATADLTSVARSLDLVSRGPARLNVGRLDGMVDAELWGRGAVDVGSGFAGQARLWVKGRGHIFHRGEAGIVSAEARLGGKIRIRQARGAISGAGDVDVGRPKAPVTDF